MHNEWMGMPAHVKSRSGISEAVQSGTGSVQSLNIGSSKQYQ